MEAKVLNFPDAMKLAQILGKYIDTELIKDKSLLDFLDELLKKISPPDYSKSMLLITGKQLGDISLLSGKEILNIFSTGLEKNKIITLLETYRTIGFGQ